MSKLTQRQIEDLQNTVIETPIDHKYDKEYEYFDCDVPIDQMATRSAFRVLKKIGKLPQGIAWIEEELKRNS